MISDLYMLNLYLVIRTYKLNVNRTEFILSDFWQGKKEGLQEEYVHMMVVGMCI